MNNYELIDIIVVLSLVVAFLTFLTEIVTRIRVQRIKGIEFFYKYINYMRFMENKKMMTVRNELVRLSDNGVKQKMFYDTVQHYVEYKDLKIVLINTIENFETPNIMEYFNDQVEEMNNTFKSLNKEIHDIVPYLSKSQYKDYNYIRNEYENYYYEADIIKEIQELVSNYIRSGSVKETNVETMYSMFGDVVAKNMTSLLFNIDTYTDRNLARIMRRYLSMYKSNKFKLGHKHKYWLKQELNAFQKIPYQGKFKYLQYLKGIDEETVEKINKNIFSYEGRYFLECLNKHTFYSNNLIYMKILKLGTKIRTSYKIPVLFAHGIQNFILNALTLIKFYFSVPDYSKSKEAIRDFKLGLFSILTIFLIILIVIKKAL